MTTNMAVAVQGFFTARELTDLILAAHNGVVQIAAIPVPTVARWLKVDARTSARK